MAQDPLMMNSLPRLGDRILTFQKDRELLDILAGRKTFDIRDRNFRPGFYWIGNRGFVHASCYFGLSTHIRDARHCLSSHRRHRVRGIFSPYRNTHVIPISRVRCLNRPVYYRGRHRNLHI